MATPKKTAKKVTKAKSAEQEAAPESKPATPAAPAIDAALHAQSAAAALLAARARQANTAAAVPTESASFKKLKEGLSKPAIGSNSPVGGNSPFAKPAHGGGFNRQPLHRQAFNTGAARTGVPRRTAGG